MPSFDGNFSTSPKTRDWWGRSKAGSPSSPSQGLQLRVIMPSAATSGIYVKGSAVGRTLPSAISRGEGATLASSD